MIRIRGVAVILLALLLVPVSLEAQTDPAAEARQLQQQAAELRAKGNHRDAVPLLRKAVGLLKGQAGADTPAVGEALNLLGGALFQAGMYREAIVELEAALAIRQRQERTAVDQTLNNLANANRGMGDLVRAEQLLLDSLGLREKLHGRDDIRVAQVLTSLGSLYDVRGDFWGESTYDRALKILRARDLREDDSLLVIVVNNFGLLLQTARPRGVRTIALCAIASPGTPIRRGDEAGVHRVFPHREPGAGGAPSVHGLSVAARSLRHPRQELDGQQPHGGVVHRTPSASDGRDDRRFGGRWKAWFAGRPVRPVQAGSGRSGGGSARSSSPSAGLAASTFASSCMTSATGGAATSHAPTGGAESPGANPPVGARRRRSLPAGPPAAARGT